MVKSRTFQAMETFLKNIPPFNLLPKKAFRQLIPQGHKFRTSRQAAQLSFIPSLTTRNLLPAEVILTPDGPPTRFLYVIHTGSVNFTQQLYQSNRIEPDSALRAEDGFFKSIEQIQARIEIRYGISTLGTR